jgi:hypothetical protein
MVFVEAKSNNGLVFIYLWLYSPSFGLGLFFSFLILYTVGRTPWTGDQPFARPLPTHRTTHTQNKRIHTPNIHALSGIRTHDPSVLGPGVDSASNRNEYQEDFWGVKRVRRVGLTTLPPSVSRLSRRSGSLDLSHPYGPSRPVAGIALLLLTSLNFPFIFILIFFCLLGLPFASVIRIIA